MNYKKLSRRDMFRTGALTAAAGALGARPAVAAAPATNRVANIYTRIGVRPFINCTAPYTSNGGTLTLPEVKEAMDEASRYSVNIDELMERSASGNAAAMRVRDRHSGRGCGRNPRHRRLHRGGGSGEDEAAPRSDRPEE